jgi:hypothetical protein
MDDNTSSENSAELEKDYDDLDANGGSVEFQQTENITVEPPKKKGKYAFLPDSFSKASLDINSLSFPLLKQSRRIDFELEAGQCLFLPVGWFHNVTSFGGEDGIHLALNIWTTPYSKSQSDNYWKDKWIQFKNEYLD